MKRLVIAASLFVWLVFMGTEAFAFYCGNTIVSEGDTAAEVISRCGHPARVERHEEKERDVPTPSGSRTVYILVEEWTYNFGPNDWLYSLRFENGSLVRIESKGYGF